MVGWLPAVLLVPAALVTGVVVTAEDDELDQVRAVHPLDVGTTWVYAVSDHGSPSGTRTRQVTGKAPVDLETLDGVAIESHYTDYPGVGETSQLIYVGATDGRLVQYGLVSGLQASFLEPPAPLYEYPAREGQAWTYDGKLGDADVSLDVEVLGIEDRRGRRPDVHRLHALPHHPGRLHRRRPRGRGGHTRSGRARTSGPSAPATWSRPAMST